MIRADLIKQCMQLELPGQPNLTRVEARGLVNGFFELIVDALQRGEDVELPFGRFSVGRHNRKPLRGWFLDRVRVTYRKSRKFVRFVPSEGLL